MSVRSDNLSHCPLWFEELWKRLGENKMANTTRHYRADIDAMAASDLANFIAADYDGMQEYAKVLAIAKDHTTAGRLAAAAATTKVAQDKGARLV
jgi:hypothetical protein